MRRFDNEGKMRRRTARQDKVAPPRVNNTRNSYNAPFCQGPVIATVMPGL